MKSNTSSSLALIVLTALLFVPGKVFAYGGYGSNVNSLCAPQQPYTGDCSLCHIGAKSDPTPAKTAYLAGGATLIAYFCPAPPPPVCTDSDGDSFAVEGGDCGLVDCNDSSAAVYPGAPEVCGDGIDQDCSGADQPCLAIPPVLFLLEKK